MKYLFLVFFRLLREFVLTKGFRLFWWGLLLGEDFIERLFLLFDLFIRVVFYVFILYRFELEK